MRVGEYWWMLYSATLANGTSSSAYGPVRKTHTGRFLPRPVASVGATDSIATVGSLAISATEGAGRPDQRRSRPVVRGPRRGRLRYSSARRAMPGHLKTRGRD